jgi:exopolyphosphatase / guanosine-5'-triphosphate,3'-diphosphate pyrophosphatase
MTVAVVDIGSNSIKLLVAAPGDDGRLRAVASRSLDARISAGIGGNAPRLSEEGMARGLAAVQELLALARPHAPVAAALVATSAVRDAANGAEFCARIEAATGFVVRVLTGVEEARAIGRGLRQDPALGDLRNFYVFDLGGGSLECLAFRERQIEQAISLPLGCVRLTERFVADPAAPLSAAARDAIARHTQIELTRAGFHFNLPAPTAVATGGTVSTLRAVLGARTGQKAEDTPAIVTMAQLRDTLDTLAALPLDQRRQVAGLPSARADVFPAALTTLLAIAEEAEFPAYRHSFHNLRYGIAAELLAGA